MASSLPAGAGPGAGGRRSWRAVAIVAAALGAVLLLAVLADGRLLVADPDADAVTDDDVRLARALFGDTVPPESMAEACFGDDGTVDPSCLGDGQPGGSTDELVDAVVPRECREADRVDVACLEREVGIDVPDRCTGELGEVDVGCLAEQGDLVVLTSRCLADGRLRTECLTGRVYGVPDEWSDADDRSWLPDDLGEDVGEDDGLDDGADEPRATGEGRDSDAPDSQDADEDAGDGPLAGVIEAVTTGLVLLFLVSVFVGGAIALVLALRRRPRRGAPTEPGPEDEDHDRAVMAASLDAGAQQLDLSGDARAAIIAAYAMLLEGLDACAQGRRPAETPLEHLERVLGALDVRPEPLRELTTLFGEARFSDHAMTGDQRDRARAALESAAADLDRVRETVG